MFQYAYFFIAGLVFCIAGLTERVVEEEKEEE